MDTKDIEIKVYVGNDYIGEFNEYSNTIKNTYREYKRLDEIELMNLSILNFRCFDETIFYARLIKKVKNDNMLSQWYTPDEELYYIRAMVKGIVISKRLHNIYNIVEFCTAQSIHFPVMLNGVLVFDIKKVESMKIEILVNKPFYEKALSAINPINWYYKFRSNDNDITDNNKKWIDIKDIYQE
jgi:hypothetical protein